MVIEPTQVEIAAAMIGDAGPSLAPLIGQPVRLTPGVRGAIVWSGTAGNVFSFQVKLDRWDGECPFVTMVYCLDDEDGTPCTRH